MTSERAGLRPAIFSSAGGPPTEESRGFFQQRLALFARIAFVLSSGFFVFSAVASALQPRAMPWTSSGSAGYHLASNLILLATWIACARGAHPIGRLRALEAACVVLYCIGMSAPVAEGATLHPGWKYSTLLAFTSVLVGRAILLPSTPAWTLGLSTLSASPLLVASWLFDHAPGLGLSPAEAAIQTSWTLAWCVDAIALSVVTSHVIYGLRERVKEAVRLGQYTLGERLGSGGMGEVYKATHALLKRPAAVKLLPPEKVGAPALRRFEREVQLTSQLTHPNTIAIFDYGHTASGIFYYAMEYLEGIDLDRLVRRYGPLPPARVVHILRQVCGALAEAHQMGLIHRDVKPANVILCRRGGLFDVAKVVDFGLVKDLQADDPVELTGANTIAGTPLFLAPESITGADTVGPESDLYALGAVGYFLTTGRPPFEGSLIEVCGHHLHTPPARPSDRLGRSVPRPLEEVLLRCLEKDPRLRPASAAELGATLLAACPGDWTQEAARLWWDEHGLAAVAATAGPDLSAATITHAGQRERVRALARKPAV
jgi:serine/threonine-protein kinase